MNNLFPILAVETTGEMCSTAVLLDEQNFVELNYLQKHIHSQKLIEMVDSVLKQSSIGLKDIKALAVSMGPGSFTGLRIGVAAAKGLAFGGSLPIIPVNTFDAIALQISGSIFRDSVFNIINSASIDDVYYAKYVLREDKLETIDKLCLTAKEQLNKSISAGELNFGNALINGVVTRNLQLRASYVAKWAYLFGSDFLTFDYDNLEPNYIKQFVGKVKK
jgi:tRNA threonylcarbamoyladenosine biosynthesis protein TsaB